MAGFGMMITLSMASATVSGDVIGPPVPPQDRFLLTEDGDFYMTEDNDNYIQQ